MFPKCPIFLPFIFLWIIAKEYFLCTDLLKLCFIPKQPQNLQECELKTWISTFMIYIKDIHTTKSRVCPLKISLKTRLSPLQSTQAKTMTKWLWQRETLLSPLIIALTAHGFFSHLFVC